MFIIEIWQTQTYLKDWEGVFREDSDPSPQSFPMVPASKDLLTYLDPPVHSQEPNLSSSSSQVTPLLGKGTVFFVVNQIQKELLVNLHRSRISFPFIAVLKITFSQFLILTMKGFTGQLNDDLFLFSMKVGSTCN